MKILVRFGTFTLMSVVLLSPTQAQITPDQTLSNPSQVINLGNVISIEGGVESGTNLFHSFKNFSISAGQTAYFNNNLSILNIFGRVTGNNISDIDGMITANGLSNLFLINPNGFVFGKNASLLLGGSFLATSANRVIFEDGVEFGTQNTSFPVATASSPRGLTLSNAGKILIRGEGHNLIRPALSPALPENLEILEKGLRVFPTRSINFVGGNITLEGGLVGAASGNINLISSRSGEINLAVDDLTNLVSIAPQLKTFQNIEMTKKAWLDTSGLGGGNINIWANNLTLTDAAAITNFNNGSLPSGSINLSLTGTFLNIGVTKFNVINYTTDTIEGRGIITQAFSDGAAAHINIDARNIIVRDTGGIATASYSSGKTGNINLTVKEGIQVLGQSEFEPLPVGATVAIYNFDNGEAGDFNVTAKTLEIRGGGDFQAVTFGPADGGNMFIDISKIEIDSGIRADAENFLPSSLGVSTVGSGNSGNFILSGDSLELTNGGEIFASTIERGNGGELSVTMKDSITISGEQSGIRSSSDFPLEIFFGDLNIGITRELTGNSGKVVISSPKISITDGGAIESENEGLGDAGIVEIQAEELSLVNSLINAETASGQGGNIALNVDRLFLDNAQITTTAGGTGNGGNITINSTDILMRNQSEITANAVEGDGGNILINAEILLVSGDSAITASSEFGEDGTVEINVPEENLISPIETLTVQVVVPIDIITGSCLDPERKVHEITQVRKLPLYDASDYFGEEMVKVKLISRTERPLPATRFIIHDDGRIEGVHERFVAMQWLRELLCKQPQAEAF